MLKLQLLIQKLVSKGERFYNLEVNVMSILFFQTILFDDSTNFLYVKLFFLLSHEKMRKETHDIYITGISFLKYLQITIK